MPLLGAHMSIAGGLYRAVDAAAALGMETVQIFTASPSQWTVSPTPTSAGWGGKPLPESEIIAFREAIARQGLRSPCAHDSYLINLGSPDPALQQRSIAAFVQQLERAEALGLVGVVMHPGSHLTATPEQGLQQIVESLNAVREQTDHLDVETWLETTAGQGSNLGAKFEEIAYLLQNVRDSSRLGVCVDTCHIFAAGYPLGTAAEYASTMSQLDQIIGLSSIRAMHLNDSKKPLGSRVDRHDHIGEGHLGLTPFQQILNDKRFADLPMYLETKKEKRDGEEMDAVNLRQLRALLKSGR